ncbi:Triple gene block protein 3 [Narcissus common latent virus]|uniref:Movement protein TGBp3 n=1 Tax=Narcissus common latent virus TaxID=160844 RepID=Q80P39_9VIRU|nr:Triple gene block protein 3 [Narcissus common latent virus]CAC85387.1 TGB3 [Narcissus common latent virus]CAJ43608.1 Triple gene block protein 3 [Narcissus common latent virus]
MLLLLAVTAVVFVITSYILTTAQPSCLVVVTGESVRFQGCLTTPEFFEGLSKLKPLSSRCL